jgi:hypothetical protein
LLSVTTLKYNCRIILKIMTIGAKWQTMNNQFEVQVLPVL